MYCEDLLKLGRGSFGEYRVIKILQGNYFLTADLKVRRFLVLALCQTVENEETLKAKILSWYIEIYHIDYTRGKLCYCTVTYKKSSLGN